jgi:hypothetical protein
MKLWSQRATCQQVVKDWKTFPHPLNKFMILVVGLGVYGFGSEVMVQ